MYANHFQVSAGLHGVLVSRNPLPEQRSYLDEGLKVVRAYSTIGRARFIPWNTPGASVQDNDYPAAILRLLTAEMGNAIAERVWSVQRSILKGGGLKFEATDPLQRIAAEKLFPAECLDIWSWDLVVFNAFAAHEIYGGAIAADGQPMQGPLMQVQAKEVAKVRVGEPFPDSRGMYGPGAYWLAQDWAALGKVSSTGLLPKANLGPAYSPVMVGAAGAEPEQLDAAFASCHNKSKNSVQLYYRTMVNSRLHFDTGNHIAAEYYPKPAIESALTEAYTSSLVGQFHRRGLQNGTFASQIITIPKAIKTDPLTQLITQDEIDEQTRIAKEWAKQTQGASKAGENVILFYDPNARDVQGNVLKPEIMAAPTPNLDKLWIDANRMAEQRVLVACGAFGKLLYGLDGASGFSDKAAEMQMEYRMTEANVTGPMRQRLLDYVKKMLNKAGINATPSITYELPTQDATQQITDQA